MENIKKHKLCIIVITLLCSIAIIMFLIWLYHYLRIKNARIEVVLKNNLTAEFTEERKVSDFIESINGNIIDDYVINTTSLGKKEIKFQFKNDQNIIVPYEYEIEVIDTVQPVVWLSNVYQVTKGSNINLTDKILCGDNQDNKPKCTVEGNYDLNTVGDYPLLFKAEDKSGNITEKQFILRVIEPSNTNAPRTTVEPTYTDFNQAKNQYKTDKTQIGIDVSGWQGEIDFEKIKNAGVEFIMIRVGGTRGTNGEYFVDKYFKRNIEEANKYGIKAGIYFYSYANSKASAMKDAKWVIKQIKDYDIDLPIAFDWEEWAYFNDYNLSFFGLTSMAESFLETIEDAGYEGMLYSSKSYLENIWLPTKYDIWLAHYTIQTNYQGKYKLWQLCENGKIDGIDGAVDINVMYE
ncbi:MAG TPA: glycoside hydrolase family 25 protein [Candidatus Fimihabitans intestinipullorum]|uniref:Glycoside hydrolase family 25 protein n=1 Tax=Candidatus Fimihabitans intestinipullorum TaxID=2840820 RepID=A0A9D1HV87_9BACT|nr:glycoside hydrolase family 25 protein [Candidatus Fimihabitans intestinipullorum]